MEINGKLSSEGVNTHFMEKLTSSQDTLAGRIMAEAIGDTFIDFHSMPPALQWRRIMTALRVHGFRISFSEDE